ncbi:MotA/TolQ/ExbB proton channel family protein [Candidatus Fokinia crypta]|nr:MotA/TolQ/ExbB proton channel family protein [Candidatus Fokinia cryptica]
MNNSILSVISSSTLVVQLVFLTLLLMSIYSWSIILHKIFLLRKVEKNTNLFEDEFFRELPIGEVLVHFSHKSEFIPHHSLAIKMIDACKYGGTANHSKDSTHFSKLKENMSHITNSVIEKKIIALSSGIGMLGIIGSLAPFVGLLGTVWGIMDSFQSIALQKNITIATVAPGIAEALLATAIGLFVAIPSVFYNNKMNLMISEIESRTRVFSSELWGLIISNTMNDE